MFSQGHMGMVIDMLELCRVRGVQTGALCLHLQRSYLQQEQQLHDVCVNTAVESVCCMQILQACEMSCYMITLGQAKSGQVRLH